MLPNDLVRSAHWRLIGPFRGGRSVAVAGDPRDPQAFYFGSTGGGVWKTTSGGTFWDNVSDGWFARGSVGALTVAEADPRVLYAGMGECCLRNNVSHGDGVYRSDDAGRSWRHVGLEPTRHIARIRVDPRDPDVAYAAAFGHAHGANDARGVFRTKNGGRTWQRILFRDRDTGAIDLSMAPSDPRTLYAALWEARRYPWGMTSGGRGSGLFRSTDAGDTWTEISRRPGLPSGLLGRIGVAVSPSRPDRLYAIVEAVEGGLFRSDDAGESWERVSREANLLQRPFYYYHVFADPRDPDGVWVLNTAPWRSRDGGRTFARVDAPHPDHHDLWIDPARPGRLINGNDGGACVSYDDGATWSSLEGQPTAELYHAATDGGDPYWVYGAQQDNTTIGLPSRSAGFAITSSEYVEVGGGESGSIVVRPDDPNVVFASSYHGYLTRFDRRSGEMRNIMVWPEPLAGYAAKDARHRFAWNYPVLLSPHDPRTLYIGGERVFRSRDEGRSWETISPDLSYADPATLEASGGEITKDNVGAEYYATVFTIAESLVRPGLVWAGTDDGRVHRMDPDGRWTEVTPRGLPKHSLVSCIEPSHYDPDVAYLAATAYRLDDFAPYIFTTSNAGRTWRRITTGIPANEFVRVVREDPKRPGLLYAGTEAGVHFSVDAGASWTSLRADLPAVPVHDIRVEGADLVIATHGRSFWILDEMGWLRELSPRTLRQAVHFFEPGRGVRWAANPDLSPLRTVSPFPRPTLGINYRWSGPRLVPYRVSGSDRRVHLFGAGENPADGVEFRFYLRRAADGDARLTIRDDRRRPIVTLTAKAREGMNLVRWDMRHVGAEKVDGEPTMVTLERGLIGPRVAPGRYQVTLEVAGATVERSVEVAKDPRTDATVEELREQERFLLRLRDKLTETHRTIDRLRTIRRDVQLWVDRIPRGEVRRLAERVLREAGDIEEALIQTRAKSPQDILNHPIRLNAKLAGLAPFVAQADAAPAGGAQAVFDDVVARIDAQIARIGGLEDAVARLSAQLLKVRIPPIRAAAAAPRRARRAARSR